jgi:transcriptional regulator with XRE-family HTH domain
MASEGNLGRRIRDTRQKRGMSQADLAKRLDVSSTAVWNWEANGVQPRPTMLAAIARALDVSEGFLLTGQEEEPSQVRTTAEIIEAAKEEIAAINGVGIDRVHISWSIES